MSHRKTAPRSAFVSSSAAFGVVVAPSSRPSREAQALDDFMRDVNRSYEALREAVEPDQIKDVLLSAAAYEPPHARYHNSNTQSYTRWSWFMDYIACKVTGSSGLNTLLPRDQLKPSSAELMGEIDAQIGLFSDFTALLATAKTQKPAITTDFQQAITAFDALKKDVMKLRNLAADISEGRSIQLPARGR